MSTVRPTMVGSLPKWLCQKAWLKTTTGSASGTPSSATRPLPSAAPTPSTLKKDGVAALPAILSGSPSPKRLTTVG